MMMHRPSRRAEEVADFCADMERLAQSFGSDMAAALEECKPIVARSVARSFDSQTSASLEGWLPRKDPGDGHPLLNESGALRAAATGQGAGHVARVNRDTLEWGVEKIGQGGLPGAAVHQFGATIRPVKARMLHWIDSAGEHHFASQVTIPARPYLGVWDDDLDEIADTIADFAIAEVV